VLSLVDGTAHACPGGPVRLLGTRVQAEEARLAAGPGQREIAERPVDTGGLGALEPSAEDRDLLAHNVQPHVARTG